MLAWAQQEDRVAVRDPTCMQKQTGRAVIESFVFVSFLSSRVIPSSLPPADDLPNDSLSVPSAFFYSITRCMPAFLVSPNSVEKKMNGLEI